MDQLQQVQEAVRRRLVLVQLLATALAGGAAAILLFFTPLSPLIILGVAAFRAAIVVLAIAPVYLDAELGFRDMFGPNTDVGFGLAGGGYADDYYELHEGKYLRDQSFHGHVAETTFSIYHLFFLSY